MSPIRKYTPAQAEAILRRRRAKDPLVHYLPSHTQLQYHQSNAYYRLVTGGGRSGKTTSCLVDLCWSLLGKHPYKPWCGPFTALVFCISRQQAAMVVQKKMFEHCQFPEIEGYPPGIGNEPLIPKREIKEMGSVKVGFRAIYSVRFHNGCELFFSWSDVDDVWKNIQGPKIGRIYIDENAGSKKLLVECRKRVLDSQNPHNWLGLIDWGATGTEVNEAFEDYRARCLDPMDKDHEIFQIKSGENKAITQEALDRLAATMTEEERKIHITGESTASGLVQIYGKQFDDKRHMLPVDYEPADEDNLWLSYDPGVDHPTGMLMSAVRRDQPTTLYFVKFWNHARQTLDYDIMQLEHYLRGRKLAGIIYDAQAGAQDKRDGGSLLSAMQAQLMAKRMMPLAGFFKSHKRHYPGISMMRHYLDPDPYNKTITPLIRINSSIASGGQLLRYQLKNYMGKEATKFTGEGGVVKKEDEGPDCARYQVMQRVAYNADWACGARTHAVVAPNLPPVPLAVAENRELTPYERHLSMSRARGRRGAWSVRPF